MAKDRACRHPASLQDVTSRVAFSEGRYKEALKQCETLYCTDPSNVENLLLLSACHFQLNNINESMFYAQQAIGVDQTLVEGHIAIGRCLVERGKFSVAIDIYNKTIRMQPRFAEAYASLGCVHLRQNCLKEAINCFEMAISLKPNLTEAISNCGLALALIGDDAAAKEMFQRSKSSPIVWLNHGNILHKGKECERAIECYSRALKLEPSFRDADVNLCGSLIALHKFEEASSRLERIVCATNGVKAAHSMLGVCQTLSGRSQLAIRHLQSAIMYEPKNVELLCNLGGLLFKWGSLHRAANICFRALEIKPDCAQAFNLLGLILYQAGNISSATKCFRLAHKLEPKAPSSCCNIGSVLLRQGNSIAAARMFKKAIAVDPFMAAAFLNLGNVHFMTEKVEAAEKCYDCCVESEYAVVALTNKMMLCFSQKRFDAAAEIAKQLNHSVRQTSRPEFQLVRAYSCSWDALKSNGGITKTEAEESTWDTNQSFYPQIATQISPQMYRILADIHSRRTHDQVIHKTDGKPYQHTLPIANERIKIAYVSSGFGNHTTGFLTQSIFAHHDKTKFFIQAISLSPCDDSSLFSQLEANVDNLVFAGKDSTTDLAKMIHEDGIHILIDLDGYTKDSRSEVFAMRPAPIQICMMGYFGTTGSHSGIDYIVVDRYLLPESHRLHFSEKIMYVPHIVNSYMEAKDCGIDFDTIDRSQIREQHGISEESFVYACFSQPYKISPEIFAVWMEILMAVPNSQLILIRYSQTMEDNLRKEISMYSVAQDRVVFWDLAPREEHMLRCCISDVILDTICSGVATSYDAIWTNTPLISIAGDKLSNRLGASLLAYLGLDELIASNMEEYKELAISLSEDENKYMDIIHFMEDSRDESDLFDSKVWMNSFEKEIENCVQEYYLSRGESLE